jgi:CBS domain-containing protein
MRARDIMTEAVITVTPETPVKEVARLLMQRGISAAPVLDAAGAVVGIVSEGDLIGRNDADRRARRDWWLALLAEGEELHPDFLKSLRERQRTARDVMTAPVVGVSETTEATEIARILRDYHVKRVPVLRDGRLVGIVSRADLLRTIGSETDHPHTATHHDRPGGMIADLVSSIERHFNHGNRHPSHEAIPGASGAGAQDDLTVARFRDLVAGSQHQMAEHQVEARRQATERARAKVKELIDVHFTDDSWRSILHRARDAAEHGEKEFLLLRFPSDLCTDGGRAINAPLPDWPKTLRGEAAEIYLRWEQDLKPRGFPLVARVLDFPEGKPGDIGLFLSWGE